MLMPTTPGLVPAETNTGGGTEAAGGPGWLPDQVDEVVDPGGRSDRAPDIRDDDVAGREDLPGRAFRGIDATASFTLTV